MTLPSSVRSPLPSAATRPSGKPTSHANQARNKKVHPPNDTAAKSAQDAGRDKHPFLFRLEHEGDHRVKSELCAHYPSHNLPCCAPPGTDKECVLCIDILSVMTSAVNNYNTTLDSTVRIKTRIRTEVT